MRVFALLVDYFFAVMRGLWFLLVELPWMVVRKLLVLLALVGAAISVALLAMFMVVYFIFKA